MSRRRILVTGGQGQLGQAIVRAFADADILAPSRRALDIADPSAVQRAVADAGIDAIVNCAAFNDVDGAEDRPADAFAVNAFAVRSLARGAARAGAALVHFGTDFVFAGDATVPYSEESPPKPRSVYAASKLAGEWFALEAPRGLVLRVESLFGVPSSWRGRQGTLDRLVAGLAAGHEMTVFTDRVVSPSFVDDIASATRHLLDTGATGLFHCVNSGHATWHEVGVESARLLGVEARLRAVTMADVPMRAARPLFCALDNRKLAAAGFAMPAWQDALRRWLEREGCPPA